MNARVLQIRALDKKTFDLKSAKNIVPQSSGWIKTVREASGTGIRYSAVSICSF